MRDPGTRRTILAIVMAGAASSPQVRADGRTDAVDVGMGSGTVATQTDPRHLAVDDWVVRYRFHDQDWGVQVTGARPTSGYHRTPVAGNPPLYDFDHYLAIQGVAYWHLTDVWDAYGSLGAARVVNSSATTGAAPQSTTDAIMSIGIRWQVVRHVSLTGDVSRLVDARITQPGARIEWTF